QQSAGGPARLAILNNRQAGLPDLLSLTILRRACPTYYSQQSAGGPARLAILNNRQAGLPDLLFTTI
ncbi:MAG TPA: hypothetical protein PKL70_18410, partial [Saprospiraceae bacterium]|nr:hypothetical protein [Saprospiraceae bacterium]